MFAMLVAAATSAVQAVSYSAFVEGKGYGSYYHDTGAGTYTLYLVDKVADMASAYGAFAYGGDYLTDSEGTALYIATGSSFSELLTSVNTAIASESSLYTDYTKMVLVTYTDDTNALYGYTYANTYNTTAAGGTGLAVGKYTGTGDGVWSTQAIPEPTSGLLLLVGAGLLALKRRRA